MTVLGCQVAGNFSQNMKGWPALMDSEIRDGLIDNLLLLNFAGSFPTTKEFIFQRRNIKIVTEELLYFLLGKLGFSARFDSSCWPITGRSTMHEFKMVILKILEELKKTNDAFRCCSVQVRKSLLDEYSGGTSAGNRIELLFFELSCVVVELEHNETLNELTDGKDEKLVFDLHNQLYLLTISSENIHTEWANALQRQRVKHELLLKERESLIEYIEELCINVNFDDLETLISEKNIRIDTLLEQAARLNQEIVEFLDTSECFYHLKRAIDGNFSCNVNSLIELVRQKFGKEYFHLSMQHENFSLDFFRLLQHIYERIKIETIPKLDVTQNDTLKNETIALEKCAEELTNKNAKLSKLKEDLETELSDLEFDWQKF